MKNYLLRHLQVFFYTLGQLAHTPLSSFMTMAVIGITLALPAGLYVLINNIQTASAGWDGKAQISVFLKPGTTQQQAQALETKIRRLRPVESVQYISPEAAMEEFKHLSGFGGALDALEHNPLPAVLVIRPSDGHSDPESLQALVASLRGLGNADLVQLDLEWVKRLHLLLRLAERGVWLLAVLLGLAVLLTIGNTIRLAILNRRDEIEIIKLIGGTNAFIRRPFLYSGLLQGLFGAGIAWVLVQTGLLLLAGPVRELATLYTSPFGVQGLDTSTSLALLASGAVLGWLGSRLAVGRHLREIEPS